MVDGIQPVQPEPDHSVDNPPAPAAGAPSGPATPPQGTPDDKRRIGIWVPDSLDNSTTAAPAQAPTPPPESLDSIKLDPTMSANTPPSSLLHRPEVVVEDVTTPSPAPTPPVQAPTPPPPVTLPKDVPQAPVVAPARVRTPQDGRWLKVVLIAVIVLAIVGVGVYFVTHRSASSETPTPLPSPTASPSSSTSSVDITTAKPTELTQHSAINDSVLAAGGATNSGTLSLSFSGPQSASAWTPEVEIEPVGTAFTNKPSAVASSSVTGTTATVGTSLKDGSYHWQARFTSGGSSTAWVSYGGNDESAADFVVDTTAPAAPTVSTIDGKAVVGGKATLSNNRPVFKGTAEPNSQIMVHLQPNDLSFSSTADATGKWTVTPSSDVPNGDIMATVMSSDAAGNNSPMADLTLALNSAPMAPAVAGGLAHTGDNTRIFNLLGLAMMAGSAAWLVRLRRRA